MAEQVLTSDVSREMQSSYLRYAMSVIISRALPDVRDGLKPVHRRILYAMNEMNLIASRPYKKSATVVGQVISAYHPHGDAAIYDALVRLAQDFSLRYPLVDGQGNFGSVDGDKAAAYRYTEVRMEKITALMLQDLEKETVDFERNYDDSTFEPQVLPTAIPNLLINGSSGIAVGMATNMPPHNLGEVIDAICHQIDHPECTVTDLLKFIKGPDFPTSGIIENYTSLARAYETGRGSFTIRSRADFEEMRDGRSAIIVSEIPYQVNKAEMIKKMAQLVKTEVLKGISEIRDESDRDGIRVVIELKKTANPKTILNLLFKHTPMKVSFGINAVALKGGQPKIFNLKQIIQAFIDHRFEVGERRARYLLKQAKKRLHIVDGFLLIALPKLDEIIKTIRSSQDVAVAKAKLIENFGLSEKQANAILEMRLSRLVAIEREKLEKEKIQLEQTIRELNDLLGNKPNMAMSIKTELTEIVKTFGNDRKSEVRYDDVAELSDEAYIERSSVVISFSKAGYVKSMDIDIYRKQNRGGKGVKGTNMSGQDDALTFIFSANTHDGLLLLTNFGKIFFLKTYQIPLSSRIAKGVHARSLLDLQENEKIAGVEVVSDDKWKTGDVSLLMISKKGIVKRCLGSEFQNIRKVGIRAMGLAPGDEVVSMVFVKSDEDVMFFSKKGLAVRTRVDRIRAMGRTARGVRAMKLAEDDQVVALLSVQDKTRVLVVSELGIGKMFYGSTFSVKGRGGKGQIYFKPIARTGNVCTVLKLDGDGDILFTTTDGKVLRIAQKDVPELSRTATGNRLVSVGGASVSDVTYIKDL